MFFAAVYLKPGSVSHIVYRMNECDNGSIVRYAISESSLANTVCVVGKENRRSSLMKLSLEGLGARIKIPDWLG